ncbi:MAG: glycosyltransferase family 4 protein [Candidatus Nanohalobium sp.]
MRLAVYHAWIHCKGGGEKVLLELLENSEHDITVFTNKYVPEDTYEEFEEYDVREIGGLPIVGEFLRGSLFTLGAMLTKLPLDDFDAFVVSTGGVAEAINFRNRSLPLIGFCHTPLRFLHDEDIVEYKKQEYGPLKRALYWFARKGYSMVEKPAWRLFDHVIFNSETTRQRALDGGLIDEERASVDHPGADTAGNEPGDYEHYFFYPSRFAYYKRQDLALDAYQEFRDRNPETDFRLVVAGGVNEEKRPYFEQMKEKASGVKGAEVRSNVPGDEWEELYRDCYSVLFTAINEDWGIIPIEAGSYEKPIISVDEGGPRESIIDGQTGLLVDDNPEAIADAMEQLASDPERVRRMGKKGKQESRKYTWERFVKRFDEKVGDVARG